MTPVEDFTEPESSDEDTKLVQVFEEVSWRYCCGGLCKEAEEVV
jgi:hypothetical protein